MKEKTRILVVDDDPEQLLLTSTVLSRGGYEVIEASSGKDALEFVRQARPVLVLLDVMLPDMSGLEVCKEIRTDPTLVGTLVVLLSGKKTSSDAQTYGLDLGADGYIVKPIPDKELLARVHSLVRIKEAEGALKISETRYRRLFETAQDGIMILDADTGRITDINPFLTAMLGYSHEYFIGKELWELGAFEDVEASKAAFSELQSEGYARYENLSLETKDGRQIDVEFVCNVYTVDHRNVIQCNIRDITQRKQLEDAQAFLLQCGYPGSDEDFFQSLARYLAQSLGMDYVCIDRLLGDALTAQTVAVYNDGKFDDNVTYTLKDTPCGDVVGKTICCFPRDVCQLFPRDVALQGLMADSYVGTTLWSFDGKPIGLIAIIGRKPLANPLLAESILQLVAVRAAGELERKQAEEVLRASEERYRSYIEVTGQLAWTTNADGQVVEDLPSLLRFTGQTEEEGKGMGWAGALHPDDVEQTLQVWKKAVATKSAYEVVYRLRRYDGVYRHFLARGVPVFERDGSIREWVGTCIDITQRKAGEEALQHAHDKLEQRVAERTAELSRANEQLKQEVERRKQTEEALKLERNKLEGILESMNDGVRIVSQNYDIQYVNPVIEKEFGPVEGRKCHEYFHDLPEVCSWCNNKEVFSGKSVEWQWSSSKTGKTYELWETPIVNANGTLSKLGMRHDITSRKQAEQALRESEDRYRTLVETMNEGLGVYDEGGVWTYANEKFCSILGHPCDEIVGRPVVMWLDEGNRKIFDGLLISQREGGQEPYELAWTRKDGVTVHTYVSPKLIIDEDGRFKGSFAVYTDITQRKQAEQALRVALSDINTLKDQLEAENIYFRQEITMKHQFHHMVGQSNAFKYVLYRAEQVAPTVTTVLVLGETGTGKELIAAAIHQMSPRKERPLITVNCAALPPNLIESELFGREKGAFTGADARRVGRFEIASGSTICLDEIGELPLEVQGKLLRVIQYGEFQRLGSPHTVKVDVRIVATTNRNLEEEVRKGRFRKDLYYRLNVFPITLPPLRQRKEDVPLLVQAFLERFSRQLGKKITSVPKETMQALREYEWPGNIRELENVIERAMILCQGPVFQLADRLEDLPCSSSPESKTLEEAERDHILKALSGTRWRINGKNGAAAILGLNPSTLRARMEKLGIRRPEIKTSE